MMQGPSSLSWDAREQLMERLAAIEAVAHAYPGSRVVEHMLEDLVTFLRSTSISPDEATNALEGFICAQPARAGAVETVEYVLRAVRPAPLIERLKFRQGDPELDFRNRDLVASALRALDADWSGLPTYRSLD